MWTPQYDIIVETLTGSEFEVTVTDKDTIGYIKSRIQKYEGIPIGQQHLLYNHKELSDATEMKDIPLGSGSRLKLVLDMKGGPVSARRVVNLPDYDSWFDLSDVLNTSRHDPLTISTPGVKLLVYKDCKKNVHRIMKLRSDRKNSSKQNDNTNPSSDNHDDQWVKDNLQTLEKMHQLRLKLDQKKKDKDEKDKNASKTPAAVKEQLDDTDKAVKNNSQGLNMKNNQNRSHLQNDQCLKTSKQGNNQSIVKAKTFTAERVGNCDYSFPVRRASCGLLNKYGLNKTCIRPPNLLQYANKNENAFHTLSPLSLPPPIFNNTLLRMSDTDLPTKYQTQQVNIVKNNCSNVTVNRPKYKQNIESEDIRSKLRENIRRNRSFKAINDVPSDDIGPRPLKANSSFSSVIDQIFNTSVQKNVDKQMTSKSMQSLIEKMSTSQIEDKEVEHKSDTTLCAHQDSEREVRLPKRSNCLNNTGSTGFENKIFIDRQKTVGINPIDGSGCAPDFKLESTNSTSNSALDGSYRLYKMSSEAKNNYELPKLLIREDSPVETFHSSDPQLETLTLRGESPKNVVDSYPKITAAGPGVETTSCDRETNPSKSIIKSPWNHHHSDLGLNNLELNFLNEDYADVNTERSPDNCIQNGSVLKIASNLEISSSWNNSSELDGQSQPSTTSLNFINGDLTSSDEEDVFNGSCCMLHSNSKSKSIELNDFRMMFGSSPTLLNSNYNSVTHTSRLDAVPIQYRRGYTNLNDACLSSSTSDLELFNGVRKKNSSKSASQELPSTFSRHNRNNNSLDFIRSYENLDRAKIIRMKNERSRRNVNTSSQLDSKYWENNKRNQSSTHTNFSRERVQEEELCDEEFSYSNLGYENPIGSNRGASNTDENLPIDFPSDENLFNMNLERFADEFNLLSSSSFPERLPGSSNNCNKVASRSSLILSEVDSNGTSIAQKNSPTKNNFPAENTSHTFIAPIAQPVAKKSEKQRCAECNKKLGLIMIMKCHCEKIFCPQHRYAEAHNCSYNFKSEGKKILSRENPLVVAQKLPKI